MADSNSTEIEIWKPVFGFHGLYEISNFGRVKSFYNNRYSPNDQKHPTKLKILRPRKTNKGHLIVYLCKNKIRKNVRISHLVLTAFVGQRPNDKMHACHFPDTNVTNNRLNNLRWATASENERDKIICGTSNRGERHGMSKLVPTDIERLYDLRKNGCTQTETAKWLFISNACVSLIENGHRWSHHSVVSD